MIKGGPNYCTVDDILSVHAQFGKLRRGLVRQAMGPNWPKEWDLVEDGDNTIFELEEQVMNAQPWEEHRMNEQPKMSLEEAQKAVETKTAPRVTKDAIEAKIDKVEYLYHERLTVCVITMRNGFMQIGKAAPADPRNFDQQIGERYSYEDAFKGLWPLEGYLLCEKLRGTA
jgi:hypothetical protein